ncbi:hypothetical protein J6590_087405 [Homalodisca vitripennis]|nr:hypothetical protein J6590_087405 [Homalodisca vitripennis]
MATIRLWNATEACLTWCLLCDTCPQWQPLGCGTLPMPASLDDCCCGGERRAAVGPTAHQSRAGGGILAALAAFSHHFSLECQCVSTTRDRDTQVGLHGPTLISGSPPERLWCRGPPSKC